MTVLLSAELLGLSSPQQGHASVQIFPFSSSEESLQLDLAGSPAPSELLFAAVTGNKASLKPF